jgi:F-type H+-transporting ATPase subunit gamma
VTKALQLVSAAKMKKATQSAANFKEYSTTLNEIVTKLSGGTQVRRTGDETKLGKEDKLLLIVFATSKGYTGALNNNILLFTRNFIKKLFHLEENITIKQVAKNVEVITVGKYAFKICSKLGLKVLLNFEGIKDFAKAFELESLYTAVIEKAKFYNSTYMIFPEYKNPIVQNPKAVEFNFENTNLADIQNILLSQDKQRLESELKREYLQSSLYNSYLQTSASEFAARMIAMKNATDNAKKLTKNLTLKYNKKRQENITKEMLEIVGGNI